ncbi:DUF6286 domain-containing Asp23/Gls24 family envelope stress response protein [Rhodococcus qingshengii]|uniref:DUF6286 domain-containing Asp23/Gls24 family envelope stress response protein n=1 Tax=Rhodococcus qingshengii TaxID=334542 RepID=UPI002AFEB9BE|nr:DUF6286 domain-containing protein [Rhodococcus qingshengii]MEA1795954.1 DUF6286 domain-containing protein [Rhodococcus qingshengii]
MAVAEPFDPSAADDPSAVDDPGLRGSLVIKDRAMAKIATAAAVNVPGVVRQSGGLTRLTGRDLPRADISMGSDAVAINLFLAVSWPCTVTELTGRVRTEVGRSVESLTGLPLHDMNVMIAATEGSDDSCASGGEISEGPAQVALSDPIPPRVPSANPAAAVSAVVIACGLLALAFVVAREWFINRGTFESAPWIRNSVEWTSRLHWQPWLLPVAIAAVVAGVVLIMSAVKRRAKTHVPLGNPKASTVWMRPTDIARLCSSHAAVVPGVDSAHTSVDRRHVKVHVESTGGDRTQLAAAVDAAVRPHLAILQQPLQLSVVVREAAVRRKDAS